MTNVNPAKELSKDKVAAILVFIPLLRQKRAELCQEVRELDEPNKNNNSIFLLKMISLLLFHAEILILKSDNYRLGKKDFKTEEKKVEFKNAFIDLIKTDTVLPAQLCLEVLFFYRMFEEACLFLFSRKKFKELI